MQFRISPALLILFAQVTNQTALAQTEVQPVPAQAAPAQTAPLPHSYEELNAVPVSAPEFVDALVEIQKLHFKDQQWDKFFAYAVYYRHKFLATPEDQIKNFRSRLFSLEILALSKHCYWDEAYQVAQEGLKISKSLKTEDTKDIEDTLVFFPALKNYSDLRGKMKDHEIPGSVLKETNYWPLQSKFLKTVSHPKVLRLKLRSRCSK